MDGWIPSLGALGLLLAYELWLLLVPRLDRSARRTHAELRADWFAAVSAQPGSEILAVQTLRNSLMSATLTASTAVLGLMGALSLTVAGPHSGAAAAPRLVVGLALLGLLFGALLASVMAVRYFNHASFIGGLPVDSAARRKWTAAGIAYVRKAGTCYSWGLRQLILVAPTATVLLHPAAGLAATLIVVAALLSLDRSAAIDGPP